MRSYDNVTLMILNPFLENLFYESSFNSVYNDKFNNSIIKYLD